MEIGLPNLRRGAKKMANWKGTSPMKILRAVAGVVVLLVVMASQGAGQVIAGPNGPVEFIGLQRWDAQELFDVIQELDPDRPFHACAAIMKQELGFADAAAFLYMTGRSRDSYTIVVGVEDSTRVRYRPTGSETVVLPETWQNLKAVVGEDMRTLTARPRARSTRAAASSMPSSKARGGSPNAWVPTPRLLIRCGTWSTAQTARRIGASPTKCSQGTHRRRCGRSRPSCSETSSTTMRHGTPWRVG